MRLGGWVVIACCLAVAAGGCNSGRESPAPGATGPRPGDLVGKWRPVRAGGQPPAAFDIKSMELHLTADGTWASATEMQGQWAGMSMKGGGKWSLADGVVSYSNGANSGK